MIGPTCRVIYSLYKMDSNWCEVWQHLGVQVCQDGSFLQSQASQVLSQVGRSWIQIPVLATISFDSAAVVAQW